MIDQSLADEFVIESKEHLESIEDDLLSLERQADNPPRPLVDKLFRAMHSIKGGAGFIGLKNVSGLSHRMETLLSMVRGGDLKPNKPIIEALLKGSDIISAMLDDLAHSDTQDVSAMLRQLDGLLNTKPSAAVQQQLTTPAVIQVKETKQRFPFTVSQYELKNRKPENAFLFVLRFDLDQVAKRGGLSPVQLVRDLMRAGEIIEGHLAEPSIDLRQGLPAELTYDVLFATPIPEEVMGQLLLDRLNMPDLKVVAVEEADILSAAPAAKAVTPPTPAAVAAPTVTPPKVIAPTVAAPTAAPAPAAVTPPSAPVPPSAPAPAANAATNAAANAAGSGDTANNTIRINVEILDDLMTLAGELVLVRNQQLMVVDQADQGMRSSIQRLNIVASELQETIMRTRMQPIGNIFNRFPRVVRDLGLKLGKQIDLQMTGNEVDVDKTILESLADPLKHLVRNSCDHGLEGPDERTAAGKSAGGTIHLRAFHEGGQINIQVQDDGRGINFARVKAKAIENKLKTEAELAKMTDKELCQILFMPGFSTAAEVTDVSGRGVGLDVVKTAIEKLGGQLDIDTEAGKGSLFHLRLPLTLAIIPCLVVMVGSSRFAIPQVNLEELVCLYDDEVVTKIEVARDQEVYRLRKQLLPLVRADELLSRPHPFTVRERTEIATRHQQLRKDVAASGGTVSFVVVTVGLKRFGVIVDRVIGTEEIVVKPMHASVKHLGIYAGATVMGDGQVALILDIEGLAKHAGIGSDLAKKGAQTNEKSIHENIADAHQMLLFRSGPTEQYAVALPLIKRIERIACKDIERVGDHEFITIDGVPTAILRLEHALKVSAAAASEWLYLLLPKHTSKPCGLVATELIDIEQTMVELNTTSHREDGVLGTAVVRGHITLFPDLYRLIELSDPNEKPRQRDERLRVLLAEDTSFFRQLVRGYLDSVGLEVEAYENGAMALDAFNSRDFDLVVSDLEMPVMNGWELLKNIRKGGRNARVPAIALTSLSTEDSISRATAAGYDRYEIKMDRGRFLTTLDDVLARCGKHRLAASGT